MPRLPKLNKTLKQNKILAALLGAAFIFLLVYRNLFKGKMEKVINDTVVHPTNLTAFLKMLRHCEGTAGINGYRTHFGGSLFDSYKDHPRKYFQFKNKRGESQRTSAAGAYQFIVPTWDSLKKRLKLPDFSPASQDLAAIELIREKGALEDVKNGVLDRALVKLRSVWASLPTSTEPQPHKTGAQVLDYYLKAGGKLFKK